jgi:flagellum-specific peptidoglycan hydrolase FlgJ
VKPVDFLTKAVAAAKAANHIFPEYAACEAALESAWGESKLAKMANNLFGQKAGKENYPNIQILTREYLNGQWVTVPANWPCFPDWITCFKERMALLQRKAAYAPALAAQTGEDFILTVSKVWATDPERGNKVLATYRSHFKGGGIV